MAKTMRQIYSKKQIFEMCSVTDKESDISAIHGATLKISKRNCRRRLNHRI